jgi:hypothetical protein
LATWHPILAAVELEPGHWRMTAQYEQCYGDIRIIRRGREVGYRADDVRGNLVGYFTNLRAAAWAVHSVYLRQRGPGEFQGYPANFTDYSEK